MRIMNYSGCDLTPLKDCIEGWNIINPDGFSQIVKMAMTKLGFQRKDLAETFRVSKSTISRWANNKSKPHEFIQISVVDRIRYWVDLEEWCKNND